MCKSGTTELTGVGIRKFELYNRRGISAAYLSGGYEGAKTCYEAETGRSFEEDLEKARKYYGVTPLPKRGIKPITPMTDMPAPDDIPM